MSSSVPSWQILTAHAQPFRGARDLAFCLKVPLDSLLVWASSGGSGETAWMRRFISGVSDTVRLISSLNDTLRSVSVAQWLMCWPCNPRVAGSLLCFSSLSHGTKPRSNSHDIVVSGMLNNAAYLQWKWHSLRSISSVNDILSVSLMWMTLKVYFQCEWH